ncbi:MAG: phosphoribosylamine--glycine ligase [Fibrobacter sp.]|jgi:phosphoribosylamine--glycine ligase|nr:phosphoribosylamine--glycine ligase [Fibrobacter sp.]
MNILVLGSGGREHSIALAVHKSPQCSKLLCAPGNPGMATIAKCIPISLTDPQAMANLAEQEQIDLTIVGPEIPLVAGVVDEFQKRGLLIFGPTAKAAALEGSKAFSKAIMKRYGVPTAAFESFTDLDAAKAYLKEHPAPIVVKASGLAAGKGAIVCLSDEEAHQAVEDMLGEAAVFGESGKTVVIEEFMEGEEASIFAICHGKDYILLASAQDHKRAFDNDQGPNTGGMGAYAPAPIVTDSLLEKVKKTIIEPTLNGMIQENIPYTGVLYVGIMVTKTGPRVVEYNCRLGDPESQIVLPLYEGDVLELFDAAAKGDFSKIKDQALPSKSAAIVVLASKGYPGEYETHKKVTGIDEAEKNGAQVLHAGTQLDGDTLLTAGGRVFGVVGIGDDLAKALDQAYDAAEKVQFETKFYRRDIGKKGLQKCSN